MDNEEVDLLSGELDNLENEKKERIKREEERLAQEKEERIAAEKAAAEEQLRIEKERLEIEKKRASLAQTQPTNTKNKTTSSSSCLSILLVFVVILGGGAYFLFSSNGAAEEVSPFENVTDGTKSREFIETLGNYASEGIEAANAYKVKKLQLQPSATQYNYKGTITYERLGRDFTNAITVTYDPEKGSIKWNILETQEELDYAKSSSGNSIIENQPEINNHSLEEIDSQTSVELDESEDIYQAYDKYEYDGVIDNTLSVTISLTRFDWDITGSYYYNKYGPDNQLELRGVTKGDDFREFELDEYNSKGKHIGVFKGEIIGDYEELKGTYTLLSKDKVMPFSAKLKMHTSNDE